MTHTESANDEWREPLLAWAKSHAELGLEGSLVTLTRVVNPTGWHANVVCEISDGASGFHAKLSRDPAEIRKVFEVRDHLTSRYRMPPILAWIDLGDLAGILMPSIRAQPAPESLIPSVIDLADRLHRDVDLGCALSEDEQPDTFREAFLDSWIERFTADLDELETEDKVPPFVNASTMSWMRQEATRLAGMTEMVSFGEEPGGPIHGDLHLANVLVEETGHWWLIDWDDLHCGDPAADLAMLLSPLIERGETVDELLGERDEGFTRRFAVCERAVLLDLVIDSLADWADAYQVPEAATSIRSAKQTAHERGLAIYRERYAL